MMLKSIGINTCLTVGDESFAFVEIAGKRDKTPLLVSRDLKDLLIVVLTFEALA